MIRIERKYAQCTDNRGEEDVLTYGKIYILVSETRMGISIRDDIGRRHYFSKSRFKLDTRESKSAESFLKSLVIGKEFEITFTTREEATSGKPLSRCSSRVIKGCCDYFNPKKKVIIHGEEDGFNIIPYFCIIEMLEIK
mgnify:CR=1 FL=1